jgi:hypothetical protein
MQCREETLKLLQKGEWKRIRELAFTSFSQACCSYAPPSPPPSVSTSPPSPPAPSPPPSSSSPPPSPPPSPVFSLHGKPVIKLEDSEDDKAKREDKGGSFGLKKRKSGGEGGERGERDAKLTKMKKRKNETKWKKKANRREDKSGSGVDTIEAGFRNGGGKTDSEKGEEEVSEKEGSNDGSTDI